MSSSVDITAPSLLGMNRWGAWALGAALVTTMALTVGGPATSAQSTPLLVTSMVIAALGVVGVIAIRTDPMSAATGWIIGATGPAACVITCLALPVPVTNMNKLNVLGVGVAVAAYLCVRGRTGVAWVSLASMIAVVVCWSTMTGQGPLLGLGLAGPNIAVLGMATLFAVIMRPAAEQIRKLRNDAIAETEGIEAAKAERAERELRRRELGELAFPILSAVADRQPFLDEHLSEIKLVDGQLRDGILARALQVPAVIAAARGARSRAVDVRMFDDGGMSDVDVELLDALREAAAEALRQAEDGSVTIRIQPAGRDVLATVVAERADGTSTRLEFDAQGPRAVGTTSHAPVPEAPTP
jgi:hypothetical protein